MRDSVHAVPDDSKLNPTPAPLPDTPMHRREFLIGGMKVGLSFLALDALALPAFAQAAAPPGPFKITQPPEHLDDSLNIMAAFLAQYQPPREAVPTAGSWRARYDILEWIGTARSPLPGVTAPYSRRNRVVGRLAVMRRPAAGPANVGYDVDYSIELNGFVSTLRASMQCAVDVIPFLREWDVDYEKHAVKAPGTAVSLSEDGLHENGVLTVKSRAGERRIPAPRPVVPQWAVMDALRSPEAAGSVANVEFDLFHNLTSFRPRQRVRPCGTLGMSFGSTTTTLHGFVQTGSGTEPIHYWLDGEGRPLLFTGGLMSYALTGIDPA